MVKRKTSRITQAMRTKYAAPVTATVIATAIVGIGAWVLTLFGVTVPDTVDDWATALAAVAVWHYMPVEWESK